MRTLRFSRIAVWLSLLMHVTVIVLVHFQLMLAVAWLALAHICLCLAFIIVLNRRKSG